MFVEYVNSKQISDVDGFHLDSSDIVDITSSSSPQIMHNLIQSLKLNCKILESIRTH